MTIFDNFWQFLLIFDNFWMFLDLQRVLRKVFRVFESFCDLRHDTWDTDYISDNWEQQYGRLHCDLWIESDGDSIRNSCDVYTKNMTFLHNRFKLPFILSIIAVAILSPLLGGKRSWRRLSSLWQSCWHRGRTSDAH